MWPPSPFPLIKPILCLDYNIAMSLVSFSFVSLSLSNSSHCCQGIFLKEESHQVTPFVKPLWDLLAHSIESYLQNKGLPYLAWTSPNSSPITCPPLLPTSQSHTGNSWNTSGSIMSSHCCSYWNTCPLPWCLVINFSAFMNRLKC